MSRFNQSIDVIQNSDMYLPQHQLRIIYALYGEFLVFYLKFWIPSLISVCESVVQYLIKECDAWKNKVANIEH